MNNNTIGLIKQRLEILYQMVEELEISNGNPSADYYTKAETDAKIQEAIIKALDKSKER